MNAPQYPVYANHALNFLEGLAQNVATAMNDLPGLPQSGNRRYFIRAIKCVTTDNFGPEFNFFSAAAGGTNVLGTDHWLSRYGFTDGMGERIGGAGLWRYYVDGLSVPYYDRDAISGAAPLLHVILQNISATAKVAGVAGAMTTTFWLEPQTDLG